MAYERVNWENLPSTNTPVNADNLNKLQDKLTAGTGIEITGENIINNIQGNYSTDEQVIGRWIDGKTLYRKTIGAKIKEGRGTKFIDFPGTYTIVCFKGIIIQPEGDQIKPLNFWFSDTDFIQFLQYRGGYQIIYDCKGAYNDSYCFLTIEYIKE